MTELCSKAVAKILQKCVSVGFAARVARGAASFRSRFRLERRLAGIRKYLEFRPKFSKFRFFALFAYAHSCMQVGFRSIPAAPQKSRAPFHDFAQ
jgi:hypothetical protein